MCDVNRVCQLWKGPVQGHDGHGAVSRKPGVGVQDHPAKGERATPRLESRVGVCLELCFVVSDQRLSSLLRAVICNPHFLWANSHL